MRLLFFILFIQSGTIFAQSVDYNTIILPKGVKDVDLKEKLVQLAWDNHPSNRIAENKVTIAKRNVGVAGSSWLGLITLSGNLNEFNIDPNANPNNNNFYPRYNIGMSIPLSIFMETPNNVKIAKKELEISQELLNEQKLSLRAEVLTRYQNYLEAEALLDIQKSNSLNEENYFEVIKQKFLKEEVTLDDYNRSFSKLNIEKIKGIQLNTSFNKAKIQLEELIGFPLESLLNNY